MPLSKPVSSSRKARIKSGKSKSDCMHASLTVCELFAGVGGFRVGLERVSPKWRTVWFSQWEPGSSKQWAHRCYVSHFGDLPDKNGRFTTNKDITLIDKHSIPDHTLLVGGFPCQDYSVAHSLTTSLGIEGKKGILWWQIREIIAVKKPRFCLFENVDRLLKSPASQRGRDFAIILACLFELGYSVEWRVINAAHYGSPHRRKRTFIFAYRNDSVYGQSMNGRNPEQILVSSGLMARAFPVKGINIISEAKLPKKLGVISAKFSFSFANAGYATSGNIWTGTVNESEEPIKTLREVLEKDVSSKYCVPKEKLAKFEFLKGSKRIMRTSRTGHKYAYSEGKMAFPDELDKPARTMLTSESTVNRSTHVVRDPQTKKLRILTPVEAERLQGFSDGWTQIMPDRMRYFCMGNALVVSLIARIGNVLSGIVSKEKIKVAGRRIKDNSVKKKSNNKKHNSYRSTD